MNPAISNLVISLGGMQVAKRLPMDDPTFVNYLRIGYITAQLIAVAVYFYCQMAAKKKNDLTVLKYVNPASPMNPDAKPELVTTTVKDYDLAEAGKGMKGLATGTADRQGFAMMGFLHLYMKYSQPLLIQGIMTVKGALESKPAQLHIFGAKPEGELARPFKAAGGFLEQFTGAAAGPQTDAATIKEAEKAGKGKSE